MPAAARRAAPWPATSGFGSRIAITTRPDAGGDQRIGARRRAAVMRAGLEADDDRRAPHLGAAGGGVAQRHHLGVRPARFLRVAPADDAAAAIDDDAAPTRGLGSERPTAWSPSASASRMASARAFGSAGVGGESFKACRYGSEVRCCMRAECAGTRGQQAACARGRAGLVAAHDQEILRQERPGDLGVVQRMLDVRIDRAGAVAVRDIAADAAVAAAAADRPARRAGARCVPTSARRPAA